MALTQTSDSPAEADAAASPAQVSAVLAQLGHQYKALDRPTTPADNAENNVVRAMNIAVDMPELLPANGRVVATDRRRTLLLIPRIDGGVCLAALFANGTAGLNCNTAGGAPVLVTYGKAVGLVPDSVTHVTFTFTDGRTQTAAPASGLYTAPAEATAVTFEIDGLKTTIELMAASTEPGNVSSLPTL
ncbi:MAG: hypothetical protein QOH12_3408 [Solirubrobacteraceae bacterium]|jgi:hypothetical protein|nr:hypothetical protein [Solirubrobacteraceae bacterium]